MKIQEMIRMIVDTVSVDIMDKVPGFVASDITKYEPDLKDKERAICELLRKNGIRSSQERRLIARRALGLK